MNYKKIFSLLLIFVLLFGSGTFEFSALEFNPEYQTDEISFFAESSQRMHDNDEKKSVLPSHPHIEINNTAADNSDNTEQAKLFQSKTLYVKTKSGKALSDTYNARRKADNKKGAYVLRYDTIEETEKAYEAFKMNCDITDVSVEIIMSKTGAETKLTAGAEAEMTAAASSDSGDWGTGRISADMMKTHLVNNGKTGNIIVAVLDTGLDKGHSLFKDRTANGRNYTTSNTNDTADRDGHGTHVSGTVVLCTPSNVKIMPVKVLNDNGEGTDAMVAAGIIWAADNGAKIINMSLGGFGSSSLLTNACNYAVNKGAAVVAAAGNEADNADYYSPANIASVITVAATDKDDNRAWFSNYGKCVDISAPGVAIKSSVLSGKYALYSGTSMASPHAASAAVMICLDNTSLNPAAIRTALHNTSIDLGIPGRDILFGAGVIDLRLFFGINVPLQSFELTSENLINAGHSTLRRESDILTGTNFVPFEATDKSVNFTSGNNNIARYDNGFVVYGVAGKTVITATTTSGGFKKTCTIEISDIDQKVWLYFAAPSYAGGNGSSTNPYLISTPEQLAKMTQDAYMRGENFVNKYYKLTADIDLSGKYWFPIQQVSGSYQGMLGFFGHLDGDNYKIKNMVVPEYVSSMRYMLIASFALNVQYGSVRNLHFEDVDLTITPQNTGMFGSAAAGIGYCASKAIIENCSVTGKMSNARTTGGLFAIAFEVTLSDCWTAVDIYNGKDTAGGLVGELMQTGNIKNSYATGTVRGETLSGGLAGYMGYQYNTLTDCYFTGTVVGSLNEFNSYHNDYYYPPGGLVGFFDGGKIENCYAAAEITGTKKEGLVGYHESGTVTNSYFDNDITNAVASTAARTTESMIKSETFKGFNFNSIWSIDENSTYPYLKWQKNRTGISDDNTLSSAGYIYRNSDKSINFTGQNASIVLEGFDKNIKITATSAKNGSIFTAAPLLAKPDTKYRGTILSISESGITAPYSINITRYEDPSSYIPVAVPSVVTGLVYNGTLQTGVLGGKGYTVENNTKTNAGTHTAIVTPDEGYMWDSGEDPTESRGVEYAIAKAPVTVTAEDKQKKAGETDPLLTWTVYPALFGSDVLTGSLKHNGIEAGTYDIIENTPFANSNYEINFIKGKMTIIASQLKGDLNLDFIVNAMDLLLMKQHILKVKGKTLVKGTQPYINADMNDDGVINGMDLLLLKKKILS